MNLFLPLPVLYRIIISVVPVGGSVPGGKGVAAENYVCIEKGNGLCFFGRMFFICPLVYVCIIQMIYVKGSSHL